MAQRMDPYTAEMRDPWHRDLVLATMSSGGARAPLLLDEWAREVAYTYSREGTLEVTALVWALLGELDRRDAIHEADEVAMLRSAESDPLRELAEWLVSLSGSLRRPDSAINEAITRARVALGRTEKG